MSRRRGSSGDSPISLFSFQDIITSVSGIMIFIVLLLALELDRSVSRAGPIETEGFEVSEELHTLAAEREQSRAKLRERREEILRVNDRLAELEALDWDNIDELSEAAEHESERLRSELLSAQASLNATIEEAAAASDGSVEAKKALIDLLTDRERLRQALAAAKEHDRLALIPERETGKRAILVEWDNRQIGVKLLGTRQLAGTFTLDDSGKGEFTKWLGQRNRRLEYVVLLVKPSGFASFEEMKDAVINEGFDVGWEPLGAGQTGVF